MARTFIEITDALVGTWKFGPQGKDRGTLALKLAEWCRDKIERAEWLLTAVDEFDEYPGPATLRKLVKDKFEPAGPLAPYRGFEGEPRPILPEIDTDPVVLSLAVQLMREAAQRRREGESARKTHEQLTELMGGYGDPQ